MEVKCVRVGVRDRILVLGFTGLGIWVYIDPQNLYLVKFDSVPEW